MIIIKEWVHNIFMIVIAISFIEIILPSGSIKKYLKFIFSLVVLAVIIGPLMNLSSQENENAVNVFSSGRFWQEGMDDNSVFIQKYTGYTIDVAGIYQDKIKEKIIAVMAESFQGCQVDSIVLSMDERPVEQGGGYVRAIQITLSGSYDRETIRDKVAQEIGIVKSAVTVNNEG